MPYVLHAKSRASRSHRRPKSRFYKKVSRVLSSRLPIKKTNYSLSAALALPVNELIGVGPINFQRIMPQLATGALMTLGGEVGSTGGVFTGDMISGNVMYPKLLKLRGVLTNYIFSPEVTVRMYLVRSPIGSTVTLANMFVGLTKCKLLDQFAWTNNSLIAQKDFKLRTAQHTGNYYLPQSKPGGGTSANAATGTYWDTPGVGILGNTNSTYESENLVFFNANTMSGSFAPHCLPFTWDIKLSKKVPKITYLEGTSSTTNMLTGDACVFPTSTVKDYTYQLFAYCYSNPIPGTAPILNSCSLDELTIQTFFKAP